MIEIIYHWVAAVTVAAAAMGNTDELLPGWAITPPPLSPTLSSDRSILSYTHLPTAAINFFISH